MYQFCEIDSSIMGINVAKIIPTLMSLKQLDEILIKLQSKNFELAYWAMESDNLKGNGLPEDYFYGYCGAQNITYTRSLKDVTPGLPEVSIDIKPYSEDVSLVELRRLSIECSLHSRFRNDPRIPDEHVDELYRIWMDNSVKGIVADKVLVAYSHNKIAGFITYSYKARIGKIGLIAVESDLRRNKFGTALICEAQSQLSIKGCEYLSVITQSTNTPARRLYEECGFNCTATHNMYHFWL